MSIVMTKVLVLNASYEPLSITTVKRAVSLLMFDKAELVVAMPDRTVRSVSIQIAQPSVVRLVRYVNTYRFPFVSGRPTRAAILARDEFTCQYCGQRLAKSLLSVDHVIPRSRGGRETWENLVAACLRCNGRKADRTPAEARLALIRQPERPRYPVFPRGQVPELWQDFYYN